MRGHPTRAQEWAHQVAPYLFGVLSVLPGFGFFSGCAGRSPEEATTGSNDPLADTLVSLIGTGAGPLDHILAARCLEGAGAQKNTSPWRPGAVSNARSNYSGRCVSNRHAGKHDAAYFDEGTAESHRGCWGATPKC